MIKYVLESEVKTNKFKPKVFDSKYEIYKYINQMISEISKLTNGISIIEFDYDENIFELKIINDERIEGVRK